MALYDVYNNINREYISYDAARLALDGFSLDIIWKNRIFILAVGETQAPMIVRP